MKNYLLYRADTGEVTTMIQTDDPTFLSLNIPRGQKSIISEERNPEEIDKIDITTSMVKKKKRLDPKNPL